MSDQIKFTGADGRPCVYWPGNITKIETSGSRQTFIRNCGTTPDLIDEDFGAVVAKLNDALNPPGPGDVTVRQIQKALKPLQGIVSEIVSLHVYEDATGVVDMDDEELVGGADNPLDYIASVMPKPAPDPRDELQEVSREMLKWMCSLRAVKCTNSKELDTLINRAEQALKEKP